MYFITNSKRAVGDSQETTYERYHRDPFHDGNKRTGYTVAAMFLLANGYDLLRAEDPAARVVYFERVAAGSVPTEELAGFYRHNTTGRIV